MSEVTDAVIQFGEVIGYDAVLLAVFLYELYWPDKLHPTQTKLKRLFLKPSPDVLAALEAVYAEHGALSREKLVEILDDESTRKWDFKVEDLNDVEDRS